MVVVFGVRGEKRYNMEIMASPSGRITLKVYGDLCHLQKNSTAFEKQFLVSYLTLIEKECLTIA